MLVPDYALFRDSESRFLQSAESTQDLSDKDFFWFNYSRDILNIKVRDSYDELKRNLNFNWFVLTYEQRKLVI